MFGQEKSPSLGGEKKKKGMSDPIGALSPGVRVKKNHQPHLTQGRPRGTFKGKSMG